MGKNDTSPAPAAQAAVSTTKTVSGPAAPVRKHSIDVPAGWGDTVHETSWTPPEQTTFGAVTSERPDGMPTEQGFVASTEVEPLPAKKDVDPSEAETPGPDQIKPEDEVETPAVEGEAEKPEEIAAKVEAPAPAAPVESSAMIRRKALDALRLEGENRALQSRLKAEQSARDAEKQAAGAQLAEQLARFEKLKTGSFEDRLRAAGFSSKAELTEAVIRGEVPDFEAPKVEAPRVDDSRVQRLEAELNNLRAEAQIRAVLQEHGSRSNPGAILAEAARLMGQPISVVTDAHVPAINKALEAIISSERSGSAASAAIDTEITDAAAYPAPYVRATPGALDAAKAVALDMWRSGGSRPGEQTKYVKFALDSAEEMYAEKYAPILALHGAKAPTAPATKPATPAARPSPPIGKKVAARAAAEEDDDGPLDRTMRDAWIKEGNRKTGRSGW